MKNSLVGQLPRHLYVWVDTRHTHKEPIGFVPAVWYGLVSYPGRLWGCTVMFESGAIYRNVPAHAIAFSPTPRGSWRPQDAQQWDCYGEGFTTLEYDYLRGLECKAKTARRQRLGEYLFTVAPVGDGFSAYPEQAKEFMFIKLDNGWLTVQPTDRVVFRERSFTDNKLTFPHGFKRQTTVWSAE
jgi:hypothetical protein